MSQKRSKKAEELDLGDRIAGYRSCVHVITLRKTDVEAVTELGDVVKFKRGDTVELATPWPQGMLVAYLYDWQVGAVGSKYDHDTGCYAEYATLSGYRFSLRDDLGDYAAGTIVPARELNELHAAYNAEDDDAIFSAVGDLLSVMGRLN